MLVLLMLVWPATVAAEVLFFEDFNNPSEVESRWQTSSPAQMDLTLEDGVAKMGPSNGVLIADPGVIVDTGAAFVRYQLEYAFQPAASSILYLGFRNTHYDMYPEYPFDVGYVLSISPSLNYLSFRRHVTLVVNGPDAPPIPLTQVFLEDVAADIPMAGSVSMEFEKSANALQITLNISGDEYVFVDTDDYRQTEDGYVAMAGSNVNLDNFSYEAVPEPTAGALLGIMGVLGLSMRRQNTRAKQEAPA